MSTHKWETIRHKSKPEGVAAPLEPLEIAAQKIAEHMGCCVDDIDLVREILNEFAAAVSKRETK